MSVYKLCKTINPDDRIAIALLKDFARCRARWDVLRLSKGKRDPEAMEARKEFVETRALLKKHVGAKNANL